MRELIRAWLRYRAALKARDAHPTRLRTRPLSFHTIYRENVVD